MAKKTNTPKKVGNKKNNKKNNSRKRSQSKNYLPTYIITSLIVTILLAIFMYVDTGSGGIINTAVKNLFCGLFGLCGFFVPVVCGGATAYLIKTKDINGFWKKNVFSFLLLVNISSIVNLSSNSVNLSNAFMLGQAYQGGGFLGACVSVFMEKMVQKVASYVILSLTIVVLASAITNVSFFAEFFDWVRDIFFDIKNRHFDDSEIYEQDSDEKIVVQKSHKEYSKSTEKNPLDAAKAFANDTKKKNKAAKKSTEIKAEEVKTVSEDEFFSNGIDEAFGKLDAEYDNINPQEKKANQNLSEQNGEPEKVDKISEVEKKEFNDEFNRAIEKPVIKYTFPPIDLLSKPKSISGDKREEMRRTAEKLISVLDNFGVKAKLLQVTQGPTVTRYEIQPDTGVKLSKIVGLADDIALNLAVTTVLVAPVPGKAAVGVEIPNNKVSPVSIREMLESDSFKNAKSKLTVGLGKDIGGNVVIGDIAKMPHVLIAGQTGSGKSVCVNSIIMSILYKSSPEDVKLIMIDPKVVELGVYNGIPHLLVPVVTEPKKAAGALNWAVTEMMRRYDLFKDTGVRKLESYNKLMESTGGEKIPQLVVIIDELADLMMVAAKEVEDYVCRLAQLARAAGIHLIIATQRPSVDVITGLIKANIPSRIAFAVSSQVDSRTILDKGGAEKLLGMGDMLYHPSGSRAATRVQGAFVSDPEIEAVLDFIKENVGEAHYSDDLAEEIERHATGENGVTPDVEDDGDALLPEAIELAMSLGKISTSMVQRRLGVGYSRAGRIIDQMEARGIISGANGSKPRDVLVSHADLSPKTENEEYDEE